MENQITFNAQVFTVELSNGTLNLITFDGETPNETVYFTDNPSLAGGYNFQLDKKLENEEWEQTSLENSDLELKDFDIDTEIFNQSGYQEIRTELKTLLA